MYSIEVNNLTKKFGSFVSVDQINFKVNKGEIFGFLGANGAGKSTTIKMLCAILDPSEGDAIVGGYSIKNQPEMVKKNIGYMSQRFSLYNDLSVSENIEFFGGVYGIENEFLKEREKWVLEIAGLKGKEKVLTASLPGGIKQRLALGTALIHKPGIVFLDEPTSGVDPISRRAFWDLIISLSESGTTVFVTTHYLEEAEYCSNIILINSGRLIAEGNSKELKSKYLTNTILEIECTPVVDALSILEKAAFVDETTIFGNHIHIIVNDKYSEKNQIKSLLEGKNITVKSIENIIPSLEDVFIHLLEKN